MFSAAFFVFLLADDENSRSYDPKSEKNDLKRRQKASVNYMRLLEFMTPTYTFLHLIHFCLELLIPAALNVTTEAHMLCFIHSGPKVQAEVTESSKHQPPEGSYSASDFHPTHSENKAFALRMPMPSGSILVFLLNNTAEQ